MTAKTAERSAVVRVNQVGYPAGGPKVAFAMLPRKVASVRFEVVTPYGVAYRGTSARDLGSWNSAYQAVYQLSFSGLRLPGQYQVKLLSPASAVSPTFTIGDGAQLYRQLVNNAVRYFTSERDGPDVDSAVLDRQPANLTDEKASVYADPKYDSNDNLLGTLAKIAGPVDVAGGWFDAGGGYEKFAFTASYVDALMLVAARDNPGSYDMLKPEATFGLQWISKLLGTVPGMRACSAGHFGPYNTKTAAYEDNVVSWPSVEPADDYTANSLLAFALGGDQGSSLG